MIRQESPRLIAHRGNRFGPNVFAENSPEYLADAMRDGFDCEVDLWSEDGALFLGHDYPQYPVDLSWLSSNQRMLWIHCKNPDAVAAMSVTALHWFFHENDTYTLTSKGYVWMFPGAPSVGPKGVMLFFGNENPMSEIHLNSAHAVCGDYVGNW